MIDRLIAAFPEAWRGVAELAAAPIAWLPRLQQILIGFFLDSASGWAVAAKCVLLLFPVLLGVAAAWCTGLAVYTLPFRSGRIHFISTLLMAWWDARSEEHTSELQSLAYLVCRLLLEKKKKQFTGLGHSDLTGDSCRHTSRPVVH